MDEADDVLRQQQAQFDERTLTLKRTLDKHQNDGT
jgi:hypothetical protein